MTVIVYVPAAVEEPTVSVNVEDPEPGAEIDEGLNAADVPRGSPDALRAIVELKPPETVVAIVLVPLAPGMTETEAGEAEIAKAGTIRVIVDVCATLPAVPVTVIVYVPEGVEEPTENVNVEDPEPGAEIDAGLNEAEAFAGSPDTLRAIAELKPPETVVVILLVPLAPWATETEVGEAEIVKAGAVTVSVTVDVWVMPPPVPVTVMVYGPAATVEATVMVMVEVPEPVAMDGGLKLTVTPVGCPVADKLIVALKPPEAPVAMVDVPLLPCATETEAGEAETVKLAGVGIPASAPIRAVPFGLPQPVTRS